MTLGAADLTVLTEFTYDQRGMAAPTGLDRDLLVAGAVECQQCRWYRSEASSMIDLSRGSQTLRATISRRLSATWKWTAESHILVHPQQREYGYWLRRDSFVQVGIARFF